MFVCEDNGLQGSQVGTGSESGNDEGKDSDKDSKKAFVSKHLAEQTYVNAAMYCGWIYGR